MRLLPPSFSPSSSLAHGASGAPRRARGGTVRTWALVCLLGAAALPTAPASAQEGSGPRVVSLGGPVTETIFELGLDSLLVGVDQSSVFPPAAQELPDVGYFRTLGVEGVLSLRPTLVLAAEKSGPPTVLERLERTGVELVSIPSRDTPDGALEKVRRVADALGVPDRGAELVARMGGEFARAEGLREHVSSRPRVLFVWGQGGGTLLAAGAGTAAETMLELAGAENAVKGFEGFQALTAEAAVAARPEVVVIDEATLERIGGVSGLLALPGLAATPAGQAGRVVTVEILSFMGFGPRSSRALLDLMAALHPDQPGPSLQEGG